MPFDPPYPLLRAAGLVRERLVDFLRRHHPESLPRARVHLAQDVPGPPKEQEHEQADA